MSAAEFRDDAGAVVVCAVCAAPGEWQCNRCRQHLCGQHIAFVGHDPCVDAPEGDLSSASVGDNRGTALGGEGSNGR